jgi:hypothetical protein
MQKCLIFLSLIAIWLFIHFVWFMVIERKSFQQTFTNNDRFIVSATSITMIFIYMLVLEVFK